MPKIMYDVLVLDANSRKALATVRSLGKHGLKIAALEAFDALSVPTLSSRWCSKTFICPAAKGTEEYLNYVESILDEVGVRVLIPSSDETIVLVRQHRARLERRVRLALASEEALTIAVNKPRTLEVAQRLGLNVPKGTKVRDKGEVEMALREVGLPAVVKPAESWSMGVDQQQRAESRLVTTPAEAYKAVEDLASLGRSVLFQQFLTGRREAISLICAQGEVYARFAYLSKRSYPPLGGIATLFQSIAYPSDIGEQAERLVREIGLEGYVQVEFRRDGAGKPYLMEINARLTGSLALPVCAGVNFPVLLYQWAMGEQIERVNSYREGLWMRYLWFDIATTVAAVQQRGRPGIPSPARAILDFCLTSLVPMRYDYVDWSDLLPVWTAIYGRGRSGLKRVGRTLLRSKPSQTPSPKARLQEEVAQPR